MVNQNPQDPSARGDAKAIAQKANDDALATQIAAIAAAANTEYAACLAKCEPLFKDSKAYNECRRKCLLDMENRLSAGVGAAIEVHRSMRRIINAVVHGPVPGAGLPTLVQPVRLEQ